MLLCACYVPVRAGMSRKRRRPRGGRGASKRARTEAVGLAPQDAYIVGCVLEELLRQVAAVSHLQRCWVYGPGGVGTPSTHHHHQRRTLLSEHRMRGGGGMP